jgi:hypothetical protein
MRNGYYRKAAQINARVRAAPNEQLRKRIGVDVHVPSTKVCIAVAARLPLQRMLE